MDRSPYLAQALQSLGQAPAAPAQGPGMVDLAMAMMRRQGGQPGAMPPRRSIGQNLQQAGQNLMGVPGRLAAVPGNVMTNVQQLPGLLGLGRSAMR